QHFDTRQSNKGDEDINPTHGGRQPYLADTGNHGNSAKKSSQFNPSDASEVRAVEMQAFKE
ncbi:hypothetical protein pdam_00021521, partial [Pocillopora damicornis]